MASRETSYVTGSYKERLTSQPTMSDSYRGQNFPVYHVLFTGAVTPPEHCHSDLLKSTSTPLKTGGECFL